MKQQFLFKMHPQLSSIGKAGAAAKKFCKEKKVLDPFCGIGTLPYVANKNGAAVAIGTDIEDYSKFLRSEVVSRIAVRQFWGSSTKLFFKFSIDALTSIKENDYDIIFTDPPNPFQISGGVQISTVRDTGLSGQALKKYWEDKFQPGNMIGKKEIAISYVKSVFDIALSMDKRIIANCFGIRQSSWSYLKEFQNYYSLVPVHETYFEVRKKGFAESPLTEGENQ